MLVRAATHTDLPGILAIFNEVVASSTAIYYDDAWTLEQRRAWFDERVRRGFPVLVALDGDDVLGFASYGDFRGAPGYKFTVEHSIHVRREVRGTGIGRALMDPLLELARAQGMHVMVGGVDSANEGSLRFHEQLGFERVAHFKEVGRKFDRWLDLVFVQIRL
jgi:L-amino acid N-acyltransferase